MRSHCYQTVPRDIHSLPDIHTLPDIRKLPGSHRCLGSHSRPDNHKDLGVPSLLRDARADIQEAPDSAKIPVAHFLTMDDRPATRDRLRLPNYDWLTKIHWPR